MSDTPKDEETGIISGIVDGFFRGLKFIMQAAVVAVIVLVIQEYPDESEAVAVWTYESLRDLGYWILARLAELRADPNIS